MKLTAAEKKHVNDHAAEFSEALERATMKVRSAAKLVGLDVVRAEIAVKAALTATGYETGPFVLPKSAGPPTQEMQDIAQMVYAEAVEVARPPALKGE